MFSCSSYCFKYINLAIHIPHFKMCAFLFELLANHECSSKFATCWCRLHLDRLKSPKTKLWDRTRNLAKLCLKCVSYGNLGFLGLIHTEDLSFHFISCATLKISFLFIYLNKSTGSVIKFIYDADCTSKTLMLLLNCYI